jgi:mRNA interferase MazF
MPFPFSDLSSAKLRPALVLADAGRGDWVLCQITSQPFGDPLSIEIAPDEVSDQGLRIASFVRPLKLFTAHESLLRSRIGALTPLKHQLVASRLTEAFTSSRTV